VVTVVATEAPTVGGIAKPLEHAADHDGRSVGGRESWEDEHRAVAPGERAPVQRQRRRTSEAVGEADELAEQTPTTMRGCGRLLSSHRVSGLHTTHWRARSLTSGIISPGADGRDTILLELVTYLSKPPPGVTRIDPRDPEVEPLLREIEAAQPAPVERVWEGRGRHRTSHLAGAHRLSRGWFLHVPWLRQPRTSIRPEFWIVLAGVAAVAVGVVLVLTGRIFYAIAGGLVTFSSVVAAGFRRRADDSRRFAESDGGPGLPGFICLPDRLLIRYPDALFQLSRAKLVAIVRHDRPHAAGDSGMAEYEMRATVDAGAKTVELTIAEVVDVTGHAERADIDARMATLLVLVDYLEQTWRRGA
jgi:hypothetical protein